MPRDANGNYTLPAGNPVVSGTVILATWANSTLPDLGDALTDSLSRSGSGGMLAPLRFVDGDDTLPAMAFTNEVSLGMYRPEAGVIGFAGGSQELARIKIDGNISVSAAAPAVDADLTRKDYVDTAVAGNVFSQYLAGYADTGLHTQFTGDLDDIAVNSVYDIDGTTATNGPPDWISGVAVLHTDWVSSGVTATQVWEGATSPDGGVTWVARKWMRVNVIGVWYDWYKIVDGGDFTTRLAGYLDTGLHVIPPETDLDDIEANSRYAFQPSNVTNVPAEIASDLGVSWVVTMVGGSNNPRTQLIYGSNNFQHMIWMRTRSGTWGAWKLVVDGGAFTERLAGYNDTGSHEAYTGDCDAIDANSTYSVQEGVATNLPADMGASSWGFLHTYSWVTNDNWTTQVLYGMNTPNDYKIWMRHESDPGGAVWSAWVLVVDGGAFTSRLAGYEDTGLSGVFTGDLDDILINSSYHFDAATVTNEPTGITGDMQILTMMHNLNDTAATQIIYGRNVDSKYSQWMRQRSASTWDAWVLVVDNGSASKLTTATGYVSVAASPAPAAGNVLTATSGSLATWQAQGTDSFTDRLAGYADTGLHESYTGDLNDIAVNAVYRLHSANVTNEPGDMTGNGIIYCDNITSADWMTQTLYGLDNNPWSIWMRSKVSTVWGAWKLVVDGGALSFSGGNATFAGDLTIPAASQLFLDGGGNTFIFEDIADRLRFFCGGAEFMRFTEDAANTFSVYVDATFAGDVTGVTFNPTGDTQGGDNAVGYHVNHGLVLAGQGAVWDVVIKNDLDVNILQIPTGTEDLELCGTTGTATFGADVVVNGASILLSNATNPVLVVRDTTNTVNNAVGALDTAGYSGTTSAHNFQIWGHNAVAITINSAQRATFAEHIALPNNFGILWGDTSTSIAGNATSDAMNFTTASTVALTLDASQNATFAGDVKAALLGMTNFSTIALFGADSSDSQTATSSKATRIGVPHYTAGEEPVGLIYATSLSTTNTVNIGGGSSTLNAATAINFYTAANATTVTGTAAMTIDASGNIIMPGLRTTVGPAGALWNDNGTVKISP